MVTPIRAIKLYFELDGGRKVELSEIKALSQADRQELASLAAAQLGETLEVPA